MHISPREVETDLGSSSENQTEVGKGNRTVGTGAALPRQLVSNEELSKHIETSDDWITERVGIKSRHIASADETVLNLATTASVKALESAGISAQDLGVIIVASITPEQTLPSMAALLQQRLGQNTAMAFDISAACSGFLFGLSVARSLQQTLGLGWALVVGAETLSRIVDYRDRNTAVLFGDGAGAMVIPPLTGNGNDRAKILATDLHTAGNAAHLIQCGSLGALSTLPGFESRSQNESIKPYIVMQGREVYKAAITMMSQSIEKVLKDSGNTIHDIDYFIPHQSNRRMLEAVCAQVGLTDETKLITNIERVGNTSAASIPIALDEIVRKHGVKPGSKILMTAVGAGMTYGSILIAW